MEPLFHVVERFSIGDIIDNNNSVGSTIITAGDGAESFLAGSVPLHWKNIINALKTYILTYNLELDGLAVQFDGADFLRHIVRNTILVNSSITYKIYSDGGNIRLGVGVVSES
jgi:hypothetical protein